MLRDASCPRVHFIAKYHLPCEQLLIFSHPSSIDNMFDLHFAPISNRNVSHSVLTDEDSMHTYLGRYLGA